jgi:hypothetical protein
MASLREHAEANLPGDAYSLPRQHCPWEPASTAHGRGGRAACYTGAGPAPQRLSIRARPLFNAMASGQKRGPQDAKARGQPPHVPLRID